MRAAVRWWLVVAFGVVTACAPQRLSKPEVRDRWVDTWVRELGITADQAGCMVDRWFAEITDAELRPLTRGAELTDRQAARLGELAVVCGVGA